MEEPLPRGRLFFFEARASFRLDIRPQKRRVSRFVQRTRCKRENRVGGGGFRRGETVAVEFEEQDPNEESGTFISIHKRLKSFCVAKPMQKLRWAERGWS